MNATTKNTPHSGTILFDKLNNCYTLLYKINAHEWKASAKVNGHIFGEVIISDLDFAAYRIFS